MTDDDKKLVEMLRDDHQYILVEGHNVTDWDSIEAQRFEAADRIEALSRAIERHEAFAQEVSDAVEEFYGSRHNAIGEPLSQFIIVDPDPLVEAWIEATGNTVGMEPLNAAIEKRGGKIVWGEGK